MKKRFIFAGVVKSPTYNKKGELIKVKWLRKYYDVVMRTFVFKTSPHTKREEA